MILFCNREETIPCRKIISLPSRRLAPIRRKVEVINPQNTYREAIAEGTIKEISCVTLYLTYFGKSHKIDKKWRSNCCSYDTHLKFSRSNNEAANNVRSKKETGAKNYTIQKDPSVIWSNKRPDHMRNS
tara:strand:- start:99 stop:485 length:387 start_codon:yes stop_codon:yes gene_type:complete